MNLSDISTPSQLQQANAEPAVSLEQALDVIFDLPPDATLQLSINLVSKLRQFHYNVSMNENIENQRTWAYDAGILAVALNCLNEIAL